MEFFWNYGEEFEFLLNFCGKGLFLGKRATKLPYFQKNDLFWVYSWKKGINSDFRAYWVITRTIFCDGFEKPPQKSNTGNYLLNIIRDLWFYRLGVKELMCIYRGY